MVGGRFQGTDEGCVKQMKKNIKFITVSMLTLIQFSSLKMFYRIWSFLGRFVRLTPSCYLAPLYQDFISFGNNLELLDTRLGGSVL